MPSKIISTPIISQCLQTRLPPPPRKPENAKADRLRSYQLCPGDAPPQQPAPNVLFPKYLHKIMPLRILLSYFGHSTLSRLLPTMGTGIMIVGLLVALVTAGCEPTAAPLLRPDVIEREIGPIWPPIFFPSIHKKNLNVGIDDLEDKPLEDEEYEIRIYEGFGLQAFRIGEHPLNLIVIRLHNDMVTTVHHPSDPARRMERVHEDTTFWNKLCRLGLFTLPDSSMIEDYPMILDGVGCVVELKSGDRYSHYRYGNPQSATNIPEAVEFMAILELLREHTSF